MSGPSTHVQAAYATLHDLAAAYLHRERPDHTLQPTALVHEAYLKLAGAAAGPAWESKSHFQAIAASAMRQILVDHARRRAAIKHGGEALRVTLTPDVAFTAGADDLDVMALDAAMRELQQLDERKCRVVELRFFGGLTCAEAAGHLGISPKTAEADWYFARAWLRARLEEKGP